MMKNFIFHHILSWFPKDNLVLQGNSVNNMSNYLVNHVASILGDKVSENGGNEFHNGLNTFEKPVSSLPSQEAIQALKDSLLNVLGKLKDDLSADSETPDNSSRLRIYYNMRKL